MEKEIESKEQTCDIHGKYISYPVSLMGHLLNWTQCPKCTAEMEAKQMEEDTRIRQKQLLESLPRRGIEPEFYNATLDNYKAETPSEREALQAAKDLEAGKIKKLVLLGDNGTGKTHLGDALVKSLEGKRITMFELSAQIRNGYNEGYGEMAILNELLQYPILVIDEVGRTKGSEAEKNWMSYLVDKFHTRGKRLMLISNRNTAKSLPSERRGEAFEYYFDNDVLSRLRQDSKIVEVKGRDRRRTLGKIQETESTTVSAV